MKGTARLRKRILSGQAVVGVIGQGYVGISLASAAASAGFRVFGIDIDRRRVSGLQSGSLPVPGVNAALFEEALATGKMNFSDSPESLVECDVICICVPTPARDNGPDLKFIEGAVADTASKLQPGKLVILESTTYPGTTEGPVKEGLETGGFRAGKDFLLAYSPERIDPGNNEYNFRSVPRVVGGHTPEATGAAALFYAQVVDKVIEVSSCRAAELAKLLENAFRHVNIALVNELAMISHETGVDVWEVVRAAATKPFGFMPFFPGPGVGGHCIPVDSTYLAWQVRRDVGHQFRLLEQAQDINVRMPSYVADRISEALDRRGKPTRGSKVFVLGVSYKPDVGDVRESPSIKVMEILAKKEAKLTFHDPYVPSVSMSGQYLESSPLTLRTVDQADCVAVLTPHHTYDLEWLADHAALVFDAQNAYPNGERSNVVRL